MTYAIGIALQLALYSISDYGLLCLPMAGFIAGLWAAETMNLKVWVRS